METTILTPERFITLSREYVDDMMDGRNIRVTKEHYYIFAISNFIATKEYFLKKNNKEKICVFDYNEDILAMMVEFYNDIKSKNKGLIEQPIDEIKKKITINQAPSYSKEEDEKTDYQALYLFNEIRNSLSHPGNYTIKEINGDPLATIKTQNLGIFSIPIDLFDFIAFYINSHNHEENNDTILSNYLIYKASQNNRKYYSFESKNAINRITKLLSKTQVRVNHKVKVLTRTMSGSNSREYKEQVLDDFMYNYGEEADKMLDKIRNAKITDKAKLEYLVELNLIYRANERLTNVKIDKCIANIESMLKLDKKSTSLYSHSIILFSNRKEPENTNAETVKSDIKKIITSIKSIELKESTEMDDNTKKEILEKYKQAIERLYTKLPDLIRIDEHQYRNSVFHSNVKFENENIIFWNQKDNTVQNDIHTFEIEQTPEEYNIELKNIEEYNINVGKITLEGLFNIMGHYFKEEANEIIGKLWDINYIDVDLLKWNMTIDDFLENINKKLDDLSRGSK